MARDDGVNELKIVLKVGGSVLEEPGMIERCARATALLAKDGHQVAVRVAAHEHDIVQGGEPVEHLRRLRARGVIAADHDAVGRPDLGPR